MDKRLIERVRTYRRDFHKYAEVKWTEFRTASIVVTRLMELGIPISMGEEIFVKGLQFGYPTEEYIESEIDRAVKQGGNRDLICRMDGLPGVIGLIDTGRPGPVTALRFDMDALTTVEAKGPKHLPDVEEYRSVNEGWHHACGHDGHTAIGLGVAEVLANMQDKLCGQVKLIFQPAEEGGGGARGIAARGSLDDVDYFFAGHVGLTKLDGVPLESGALICGVNDFLDTRRFDVSYIGRAAHPCGDPHMGNNALLGACNAALNIHAIAPHGAGMLRVNVGTMQAGVSRNTIAPNAHFELEVRGENDQVADYGERKILTIVQAAADLYSLEVVIEHIGSTPSAKSDERAVEIVRQAAEQVPWFERIHQYGSLGGTDDASDMIRRVQARGGIGTYIGFGTDFAAGFHQSAFDFDEEVLMPAVNLMVEIVKSIQQCMGAAPLQTIK